MTELLATGQGLLRWDANPKPHERSDPSVWINPQLAWRFAGLVDGEGCFTISASPRSVKCEFVVKLRADDAPMLERYREGLGGLGKLVWQGEPRPGQSPTVRWSVSRVAEVWWLCEFFETYPLWSKKARDFEVWRDAIVARRYGATGTEMAGYVQRLRAGRVYQEPEGLPERFRTAAPSVPCLRWSPRGLSERGGER